MDIKFLIVFCLEIAILLDLYAPASWAATPIEQWISRPEIERQLDEMTKAPETLNKVTLLHLGRSSALVRLQLIQNAERSILLSTPVWSLDEAGMRVMNAFREKKQAQPTIRLHFLLDFASSMLTNDLFNKNTLRNLKEIAGENGAVEWNRLHWFRPFSSGLDILSNRLHEKMMIVDENALIIGGMNMGSEYLNGGQSPEGWHDSDILIEGPAVHQAIAAFRKNWTITKYLDRIENAIPLSKDREVNLFEAFYWNQPERAAKNMDIFERWQKLMATEFDLSISPVDNITGAGKVPLRLIYDNPLPNRRPVRVERRGEEYTVYAPFSRITDTLELLLDQAQERVVIFLPYPTLHSSFRNALIRTAKRGVSVEVLTNSLKSHDFGYIGYIEGISDYVPLMSAGVKIHAWQGHSELKERIKASSCQLGDGPWWSGNTLHTKAVVIDHVVTLIGSHNLNMRSQRVNTEVMALVVDQELASQLESIFEFDLDLGREEKLPCFGGQVPEISRPKRSVRIDLEEFKKYIAGKWLASGFWHNFRY